MSQDINASPVTIGEANWMSHGSCKNFSGDIFFGADKSIQEIARAICRMCPVSTICARESMGDRSEVIWAGRTWPQRKRAAGAPLVADPKGNAEIGRRALSGMAMMMRCGGGYPTREQILTANRGGLLPSLRQIRRVFGSLRMFKQVLALYLLHEQYSSDPRPARVNHEIKRDAALGLTFQRSTLEVYFKSVPVALRLAGCKSSQRHTGRKCNKQLIDEFVALCLEYDKVFERHELMILANSGLCSFPHTYERRFGSYPEFVQSCVDRLEPVLRDKPLTVVRRAPRRTRNVLLADYVRLSREAGHFLAPIEMKAIKDTKVCASWPTYLRNIGPWEVLIETVKQEYGGNALQQA